MDTAIETRQLAKDYHHRPALRALDLQVPRGTVFGYLGPNGAGKTTTIRLLTGLIRPSSGGAMVLGCDVVRDREAAQRRIGYLPGEFTGYPDLTAEEYLRYLSHLRRTDMMPAAMTLAKRLDLDPDGRIGAMSHGNRQKVGIVQAFAHQPELLILDEPTLGLDPLAQHEFTALIREVRDAGRTVFLSSHDLFEVEAVADAVAILCRGRLIVQESVQKLKDQAVRRMDVTFAQPPPAVPVRTGGRRRTDRRRDAAVLPGHGARLRAATDGRGCDRQPARHRPGILVEVAVLG